MKNSHKCRNPQLRAFGALVRTMILPVFSALSCSVAVLAAETDVWPQFRGPGGQGHTQAVGLPLRWNEQQNITWKTATPGQGWSSPVISQNRIWMTTATQQGTSLRAVCFDRATGKLLKDLEVFHLDKALKINKKNSHASPSPVLDGEGRLFVHFGTSGTACLDSETGKILWTNRTLTLDHLEGAGSSPILWRDLLIVNCDGADVQYVVALDKSTGTIVWKTQRTGKLRKPPDQHKAFCTPIIINGGGRLQLISPGADWVYSYDPTTGKELWRARYGMLGYSTVPRPVVGHGMVFICTSFNRSQLLAVRYDGKGDVSDTHVAWRYTKQVPQKPSTILVGDELYFVSDRGGVLTCLDARTGKLHWTKRLGSNYSASPLAAAGRIYFFDEDGKTTVIKPGKKYQELATNRLDGSLMASAAVAGKALYLRTDTHLYRIEQNTNNSQK